MFSSIVEGVLQRIAGRYLKNFGPSNVSVSVTGTITLTNVQIKTEELINFQLPYKPVRAFIGSLHLDLPLVVSSTFDVRIADVLLVIERNAENITMDAATAHKALQMWIGAFYFSLLHAEALKRDISSNELEYSARLLDRLSLSIQGLHIRVEEVFTAHVPCPIGRELMTLGVIIGKLDFRPPAGSEFADYPEVYTYPATPSHVVVNKLLEFDNLSIYCYREEPLGNISDEDLTLELVRSHCYVRKSGTIFGPASLSTQCSGTYNKSTQVFGPVVIHASAGGLDVRMNDEQIAFVSALVHLFERNVYLLQQKSRVGLAEVVPSQGADPTVRSSESHRRARHRWGLLRTAIRMDWLKFASALKDGNIRWRAWFETWVMVSRYVALREILLYHVGFEAISDGKGPEETVTYSVNESLMLDHSDKEARDRAPSPDMLSLPGGSGGSEADGSLTMQVAGQTKQSAAAARESRRLRRRYQGKGAFPQSIMTAAQVLLGQQQRFDGDGISPMSLSASAVRALYAMQLEMDTVLPVKLAAQARIWAEERYRIKKALAPEESMEVADAANDVKSKTSVSLLVAVVDAVNLTGSLGMTRIEANVSLSTSQSWEAEAGGGIVPGPGGAGKLGGVTHTTDASSAKVSHGTGTALCSWGELFTLSCPGTGGNGSAASSQPALRIECTAKGIFAPSYGRAIVPFDVLVPAGFDRNALVDSQGETPVQTHHINLSRAQVVFGAMDTPDPTRGSAVVTLSSAQAPSETLVSVRILSTVVAGSQAAYQAAFQRLQEKAKEAIEERRTVVARQQALAEREMQSDQEDDEAFVLDPGVLTVKDLQVKLSIPSITACLSALYISPSTARAMALERQAPPLAHSLPIPLIVCQVRNITVSGRAANNPWIVEAQGSVGAVRVFLQPPTGTANKPGADKPPLPVLALPRISGTLNLEQTSSVGRSVGGGLDASCFDIKATLESGFFKVTLHPHSFRPPTGPQDSSLSSSSSGGSGGTSSTRSVWSAFRPLHHLWAKRAKWAQGTSSSSFGDGSMPPTSSAEATIRLGDAYTAYPKRANVINEVWGNIKHKIDSEIEQFYRGSLDSRAGDGTDARDGGGSSDGGEVRLPEQTTVMTFMTSSRCLEVEVATQARSEALSLAAKIEASEGWHSEPPHSSLLREGDDDGDDYADVDDPVNHSLHKSSSGPGALSNVGSGVGKATAVAATGIYNILTLGGILPSAIEAASGSNSNESTGANSATDRYTLARRRWMLEKAELEARIRKLEAEAAGR